MKNTLLSICIPTFNRADLLDECLTSIHTATLNFSDDIEVVISDNNSPDHTSEIIDKYRNLIKNIIYHKNVKTIFAEDNFYLVGQLAESKYIWLIGDDDKLSADAVTQAVKALSNAPSVIICNFALYSKNFSRITLASRYSIKNTELTDHNDVLANFGTNLGFISGAIINKELFYSVSKDEYDHYKQFGLSFFFTLCSCVIGNKTSYISEPIVQCRTGNSGNYDWVKYMIIGYDESLKDLVKIGYSQWAVDVVKKNFIKTEVLFFLLKLKADGLSTTYACKELKSRYNTNNFYGYICLMINYIPAPVIKAVRTFKQALLKD